MCIYGKCSVEIENAEGIPIKNYISEITNTSSSQKKHKVRKIWPPQSARFEAIRTRVFEYHTGRLGFQNHFPRFETCPCKKTTVENVLGVGGWCEKSLWTRSLVIVAVDVPSSSLEVGPKKKSNGPDLWAE